MPLWNASPRNHVDLRPQESARIQPPDPSFGKLAVRERKRAAASAQIAAAVRRARRVPEHGCPAYDTATSHARLAGPITLAFPVPFLLYAAH